MKMQVSFSEADKTKSLHVNFQFSQQKKNILLDILQNHRTFLPLCPSWGRGFGQFLFVLHDSIFLSCFTSTQIFNNSDLYLCDLFWVRRAGLQDLDLLVHVGRVHPLCSSGLFVRLIKASKQSLKRAKKKQKTSSILIESIEKAFSKYVSNDY